jgi:hypothetical protein
MQWWGTQKKNSFGIGYSRSQLKEYSAEALSCFILGLKGHTCTSDRYLSVRTLLKVAFNTLTLSLIFPVDTKLKSNIQPVTDHKDPQG